MKGRGAPDVKNLEVDGHNGAALQQELAGGADARLRAYVVVTAIPFQFPGGLVQEKTVLAAKRHRAVVILQHLKDRHILVKKTGLLELNSIRF